MASTSQVIFEPGRYVCRIDHTWLGLPIDDTQISVLTLWVDAETLHVDIDAPFHGDPLPTEAIGLVDELWHYEVVELMFWGDDGRYWEFECGPGGHHLGLYLREYRQIDRRFAISGYNAVILPESGRWRGQFSWPLADFGFPITSLNAFAMHGQGERRCYLAWRSPQRGEPDFHKCRHLGRPAHARIV